jgi:hypothetical protein
MVNALSSAIRELLAEARENRLIGIEEGNPARELADRRRVS